jgi:NDP-sugar pyrophosphorylase family protein
MILAAGRGTRLATLGLAVPKALVDIGGEPLLARQIRYLATQGMRLIVVNAHHRAEQIVAFVDGFRSPATVRVVVEDELLGTAGGVRNGLSLLGRGPIVVLYGDVLVGDSLAPILDRHARMRADATLTVYESTDTAGKGIVSVVEDGLVTAFAEKSAYAPEQPSLVNAGLYVLERSLIHDLVLPGAVSDFGHDVFPAAVLDHRRLVTYRLSKPVLDIGTPQALDRALQLARERAQE